MNRARRTIETRPAVMAVVACLAFVLAFMVVPRTAQATENIDESLVATDPVVIDPVRRADECAAVLFNATNGLPTSEANAIVQSEEGFIWIGGYSGLIRYDGNTFELMAPSMGIGGVACLHIDEQDRLWIGTNDSGLAMLDHGAIRWWGVEDGLGSPKITDLVEDDSGTIYVGTTAGVCTVEEDLTLRVAADYRIGTAYVDYLSKGEGSIIYCLTNTDDYFAMRKGLLVEYIDHTKTSLSGMTCIAADLTTPGSLYIATEDSLLYHGNPKRGINEMEVIDISPLTEVRSVEQIGDQIWLCARNGIGLIDDAGFHFIDTLPLNGSVNHVIQDYEGNLWFTSSRQGVMELAPNQLMDLFARYGLENAVVNTTCMLDGQLFVGTDTGLLVIGQDGLVPSVPLTSATTASGEDLGSYDLVELLDGCRIRSIIRDSQNRLWISTWRELGLLRYDAGEVVAFNEEDGFPSDHFRAVSEAPDGSMVVACTGGVGILKDGQVTRVYDGDDGIENTEILTVTTAPDGTILAGTDGGGIYLIDDTGTRHIDAPEDLSSGIVMRIKYDQERNVYWLVTSNSLAYLDADYHVTTVTEFPYSNNFDLYENSKGDLWVLSSNGIYVAPADQVIENGSIDFSHYGIANGLPHIATSNSYSELTPEGDLYIAGSSGVTKVNIESSLETIDGLKQSIPFVDANGVRIYPDASGGFTLAPNVRKLVVHAYVYTYSLTNPQVSYQLQGFDEEPVTLNRSELGPISYTNLPGGSYRFVMQLQDSMGRETKTTSVTITKQKHLYEEPWFWVALALALGLTITYVVREYVNRKMRALEEEHRVEAERERITNELQMANRIQEGSLPHVFPPFPERQEFDLYASMDPAREVGGDFYDFFFVDDDHLALVIADVSGKGIPAALFMMISKVILQSFATAGQSVADVLANTNEALCADNQADMFVTIWLGVLEISTGKLVAANAGHEYPAIKRANGRFELLKDKHGLMVGIMEGVRYKEYELMLDPGDKIFVYTDGVPEATALDEEMFGFERMLDALNAQPDATAEQLLHNVQAAVDTFVGSAEQFDDLTMLCLEYRGAH